MSNREEEIREALTDREYVLLMACENYEDALQRFRETPRTEEKDLLSNQISLNSRRRELAEARSASILDHLAEKKSREDRDGETVHM